MSELLGIDVSHHNGTVDWNQVAAAGYRFVFLKATEGTTFVDPRFRGNWAASRSAGLLRGAYHFARPGRSGAVAQAEHFARTIGVLRAGDLPAVLDLEDHGDLRPADLVGWTQEFLDRIERRTGRRPILYSGPGFWPRTGNTTRFTGYPLWQAQYGPVARRFGGWPGWTFWQFTDRGRVPGVGGGCDVNRYAGDLASLRRLAGLGRAPQQAGEEIVALSPELKQELDEIKRELADIKGKLVGAYNVLEYGDPDPATGDDSPRHHGIVDVLRRIDELEKKFGEHEHPII